jgi:hypothetical protein
MKILLATIGILWCSLIYSKTATEQIPNFKEENVPVLNDELRRLRGDINNMGDVFSYQDAVLADDAMVDLPDATSGIVIVSCNAEGGIFLVQTDGTVTLIVGTGNVDDADTDTDLCCFDNGTGAVVKNRLGATGRIVIDYKYQ